MNQSNHVSIKRNTIYNAIKTISSILFPLVIFPYVSRVLLPENFGKVNFGTSIVSYFSLLATLGISTYAIRACSAVRNDDKALEDTASQIFSISIVTTVIAYFFLMLFLFANNKLEDYRHLIAIQSLSILATTVGADWLNSAMEDFRFITVRTVAFQFISLLLVFIFVRRPEDYLKFAVISMISSAGASVLNVWHRQRFCRVHLIIDLIHGIEWKRHMIPIMSLFTMLLSQQILNNLDVSMLGFMKGDREVGLYSTAMKIYNLVTQAILSITWVVLPRLTISFNNKDYNRINALLNSVVDFTLCLGLPCFVGLFILADDVLMAIAGGEFVEASECLMILSVSMIFMFLINIFGNLVLLPKGEDKTFTIAWIAAMAFNIISNAYFIPRCGIIGAAITTLLANMIVAIICIINVDKAVDFGNKKQHFIPPIIGTILVGVICILSKIIVGNSIITIVVSIIISIIVYVTVLILCRYQLVVTTLNSVVGVLNRKKNKD
ncbi:flippase [Butyrivibrio sp. VCB2001]|uniref:flippase n=1 Tax=Butyrivibrio sp. VCB2001 TaxID=1280667 RepID=UPI0004110D95|nr:flippase [Butyrivibrio sp. VCB2001]